MFDNIDQTWLKSFHCVYENNSFKRAAECLNIPTSNVSRHIALLEEKLNIRLFNRTTRRMTPTEAGEELYSSTRPLLEQLNNALETVTRHSHTVTGELRILMPDTPVLAKAVVTFCTQYPSISLSCDTTLNPKDEIESGKLEVIPLEYEPEDLVLYAFYSSRKHLAKKISMFVEHLKQHAKLNA
ncbi:LysR family transcriptional regulator [Vibrio diabolicus]|uniref:LysR family transcriptional regulator n=1 Tax=Vibrio diabolicus TaxID=50719 RepID=UPI0035A845C2